MSYAKHFIPLESNPVVFTELAHSLGLSTALEFCDVLSVNEPDLLALIPRPTLTLVLVFPASSNYEEEFEESNNDAPEYSKSNGNEDVIWFKQTIYNACGLYALLHAVTNGAARDFIRPNSYLSSLLESCEPLDSLGRATILNGDAQLESAYKTVALQGDTEVPEDAEEEVDFHYVCFVKSHKSGHLYQLDGDQQGPIDMGALEPNDDMLSERAVGVIREFIEGEADSIGFSLLALARKDDRVD